MSASRPRLRVFAGPNGSGKSTLKDRLPPEWLGVYVNADDIEKTIRATGALCLDEFSISVTTDELTV
jgi:predicted ABC-type ATPase